MVNFLRIIIIDLLFEIINICKKNVVCNRKWVRVMCELIGLKYVCGSVCGKIIIEHVY